MPLPRPREGEEQKEFIPRCMDELSEEFPDGKQRLAVCYSQWRKKHGGEPPEDKPMARSWYEICDAADVAEVLIYDEIGLFGVTAKDFITELQGIKAKSINLRVNSPGGDVFDAISIYNSLKNHKATVNVIVDGLAASSASFIVQAGDTRVMATGSTLMIHEPHGMTMGDAEDHAKMAEALNKMGDTIASLYAGRAGGDEDFWRGKMKAETWYRAQEAVDAKLADGLVQTAQAQIPAGIFNLSKFKNVPDWLKAAPEPEPEPVEDIPILEGIREGLSEVVKRQKLPEYDFASAMKQAMKGD